MPTTILKGPVIAGRPDGYPRYWETRISRSTVRRKRPTELLALLKSPTSLAVSRFVVERSPTYTNGVIGSPTTHAIGSPMGITILPPAEQSSGENQARIKLLAKIKDTQWQLGTFLAELPTTQKYLVGAVKEIVGLYRSVRKGNMKSIKRLAKRGRAFLKRKGLLQSVSDVSGRLSKRWLEWRYAVCPIVYDLDDMLKALHTKSLNPLVSRSASGAKTNYVEISREVYPRYTVVRATESVAQHRACCYYSVNPHAAALKKLGLINLAETLWEVTPLSFVVDWFLPVGDYIGHLDAMAGVTVLSSTMSTRCRGTQVMPGFSYQQRKTDGTYYSFSQGPQKGTGDFYSRVLISLKPSFAFGTSPAGKQLIDAVALSRLLLFK